MPTISTARRSHPHRGGSVAARQQVLVLYLSSSDLQDSVSAWAFFDGTTDAADRPAEEVTPPPYERGIDALRDGWRLMHYPRLLSHGKDEEAYAVNYLPHEFVFEKWLQQDGQAR